MRFSKTTVEDAWLLELEPRGDDRGWFARTFCRREFEAHGLIPDVVQSNTSFSKYAGTLRGLHFQKPPAEETKLVRCVRGSLYDVAVDLRPGSPTYLRHFGTELTERNGRMLYVPRGCAHGFLTLEDDTEALYLVSEYYAPDKESGARYDDPAFGIEWPREVAVISEKDAAWPFLADRSDIGG